MASQLRAICTSSSLDIDRARVVQAPSFVSPRTVDSSNNHTTQYRVVGQEIRYDCEVDSSNPASKNPIDFYYDTGLL